MTTTIARTAVCMALGACLLAAPAFAETITFDLANPGPVECGTTWQVLTSTFTIVQIPANHACTGSCFPGSDNDLLWLYSAALELVFDGTQGVTDVEIDVSEFDGSLTAAAWLYYDDGQSIVDGSTASTTGPQTLRLNSEGLDVDQVVVACCECSVTEIRLTGPTIVNAQSRTWSAIKALF